MWQHCGRDSRIHRRGARSCWELIDGSRVPMRVWLSLSECAGSGGGGLALVFSSNGPMEILSVTLKNVAATSNSVIGGQTVWWWWWWWCVCALSAIWIGAGMLPMAPWSVTDHRCPASSCYASALEVVVTVICLLRCPLSILITGGYGGGGGALVTFSTWGNLISLSSLSLSLEDCTFSQNYLSGGACVGDTLSCLRGTVLMCGFVRTRIPHAGVPQLPHTIQC